VSEKKTPTERKSEAAQASTGREWSPAQKARWAAWLAKVNKHKAE